MEPYDAFVSYSRADEKLVKAVVDILRVGGRRIFWDATEIAPGERWAQRVADAVASSSVVVILWCCHSARSLFVRDEVTQAAAASRAFVPVRLCAFPLTSTLSDYQWVDCREIVVHTCQEHASTSEIEGDGYDVESYLADVGVTEDELDNIGRSWSSRAQPPSAVRTGCFRPSLIAGLCVLLLALTVTVASASVLSFTATSWIAIAVLILAVLVILLRSTQDRVHRQYSAEGVIRVRPEHVLALIIEVAVRDAKRMKART